MSHIVEDNPINFAERFIVKIIRMSRLAGDEVLSRFDTVNEWICDRRSDGHVEVLGHDSNIITW